VEKTRWESDGQPGPNLLPTGALRRDTEGVAPKLPDGTKKMLDTFHT